MTSFVIHPVISVMSILHLFPTPISCQLHSPRLFDNDIMIGPAKLDVTGSRPYLPLADSIYHTVLLKNQGDVKVKTVRSGFMTGFHWYYHETTGISNQSNLINIQVYTAEGVVLKQTGWLQAVPGYNMNHWNPGFSVHEELHEVPDFYIAFTVLANKTAPINYSMTKCTGDTPWISYSNTNTTPRINDKLTFTEGSLDTCFVFQIQGIYFPTHFALGHFFNCTFKTSYLYRSENISLSSQGTDQRPRFLCSIIRTELPGELVLIKTRTFRLAPTDSNHKCNDQNLNFFDHVGSLGFKSDDWGAFCGTEIFQQRVTKGDHLMVVFNAKVDTGSFEFSFDYRSIFTGAGIMPVEDTEVVTTITTNIPKHKEIVDGTEIIISTPNSHSEGTKQHHLWELLVSIFVPLVGGSVFIVVTFLIFRLCRKQNTSSVPPAPSPAETDDTSSTSSSPDEPIPLLEPGSNLPRSGSNQGGKTSTNTQHTTEL